MIMFRHNILFCQAGRRQASMELIKFRSQFEGNKQCPYDYMRDFSPFVTLTGLKSQLGAAVGVLKKRSFDYMMKVSARFSGMKFQPAFIKRARYYRKSKFLTGLKVLEHPLEQFQILKSFSVHEAPASLETTKSTFYMVSGRPQPVVKNYLLVLCVCFDILLYKMVLKGVLDLESSI